MGRGVLVEAEGDRFGPVVGVGEDGGMDAARASGPLLSIGGVGAVGGVGGDFEARAEVEDGVDVEGVELWGWRGGGSGGTEDETGAEEGWRGNGYVSEVGNGRLGHDGQGFVACVVWLEAVLEGFES